MRDSAAILFVWKNPDLMSYVRQGSRSLASNRFGALPSHGRVSRATNAGRYCRKVYRAWHLWQVEREKLKEHSAKQRDLLVLRDESEAVHIFKFAKLARNVDAGQCSKEWLNNCILPRP